VVHSIRIKRTSSSISDSFHSFLWRHWYRDCTLISFKLKLLRQLASSAITIPSSLIDFPTDTPSQNSRIPDFFGLIPKVHSYIYLDLIHPQNPFFYHDWIESEKPKIFLLFDLGEYIFLKNRFNNFVDINIWSKAEGGVVFCCLSNSSYATGDWRIPKALSQILFPKSSFLPWYLRSRQVWLLLPEVILPEKSSKISVKLKASGTRIFSTLRCRNIPRSSISTVAFDSSS